MVPLKSNLAADRLISALETQRAVLREEQERTSRIDEIMEEAKRRLEDCAKEKQQSMQRQATLSSSINMFEELLKIAGIDPVVSAPNDISQAKEGGEDLPVARLGKQHYLMLSALRAAPGLEIGELVAASGATPRRVKMVMSNDKDRGLLEMANPGFRLTRKGADLLDRFETYRRNEGKPVPTLLGLNEDDDGDDLPEDQASEM